MSGRQVRFSTTAGSFNASSLQQTATAATNGNGDATVTLYGSRWSGTATVAATDDATTPDYASSVGDTYRCDWETLSPITISLAAVSWTVTASPTTIARCGSQTSAITANVQVCGSAPANGTTVRFTIPSADPAVFVTESGVTVTQGGKTVTTTTMVNGGYGRAVVHVTSDSQQHFGIAAITTSLPDYEGTSNGGVSVTVGEYSTKVGVTASPGEISGSGYSTVVFTARNLSGQLVPNLQLSIRTTAGSLTNMTPSSGKTNATGQVSVRVNMNSAPSAYVSAGYTDACAGSVNVGTVVVYRQSAWKSTSVEHSSILVDDLTPSAGNEVAVISKDDGKGHIWSADGSLEWI